MRGTADANDPVCSDHRVAVIRLVRPEPEFRIVPGVHDEAMIALGNPVQVLQFVVLAERKGQDVLHRVVDFPISVALPERICITCRDRVDRPEDLVKIGILTAGGMVRHEFFDQFREPVLCIPELLPVCPEPVFIDFVRYLLEPALMKERCIR